ncbi:MAG: Zn-dependent exopeptidase M28 [Actinobacteria bacterium]|nr:MAG: Zn-dependent exopeptidase M28 [Actinomycetota bacterium]
MLAVAIVVAACATGCGGAKSGAGAGSAFDADRAFRDLRAQVAIGPRPAGSPGARREVRLIRGRLRSAGLRDVRVQRPYRNVVARIPGAESGTVVVGAHYDTKDIPRFVGANDGASGVAVLLELARTLPARLDGPSIDLAFFDAEESPRGESFDSGGDRGSGQFVRYARGGGRQGSPPLLQIRAMVLFDMVGDCDLHIPLEANSDAGLYSKFSAAAQDESGSDAPFGGEAAGVLDDHTPFLQAGVPAVDLIDFDYGPGPSPGGWWHTRQDDLRHVCARSLGEVGAPALAALPAIR